MLNGVLEGAWRGVLYISIGNSYMYAHGIFTRTAPVAHRPNVDCPEAVVQLYLDCTALEAEDRPTAQQLYSRLHAIVMGTDDVQPTHAGGGDGGDHAGAGDHAGGSHATSAAQGAASGHEKTQHTAAHTRGTESADAQGAPRTHGHVPHAGDTGDASVFAHDHALLSASTTVFFADDDSDTA